MPSSKVYNDSSTSSASDVDGVELKYNDPTANGGTAMYNGNISETIWKTAGDNEASYGYEYDAMNRLTESAYYSAGKNNRFNESILNGTSPGYDLNGNIMFRQRTGKTGENMFGNMDNLTYTYTGNQLTRVDDAVTTAAGQDGFKELVKTANEYTYDGNGNMTADANKGITQIKYNYLNLPRTVKKSGADSIVYTYNAAGVKLKQRVYGSNPKVTEYAGEFIYENDTLRFINHEEGRVIPDTSSMATHPWEYQYNLKDHLGNVRVTFSEQTSTTEYATSLEETTNTNFHNYTNRNNFSLGKRTGSYSQKLTGGSNSQIGLARSFEVNAGDVFDLEVYAKYESFDEGGTATNLNALIGALAGAFSLNPSGGTGLDGQAAYNAFNTHYGAGSLVDPEDIEDDDPPRAFLNYILFDENFVLVDFGFDQVSTDAEQVGVSPNVLHDYLSLHVKVKEKGYLYVYLSNENPVMANVYFDDLTITRHTAVAQSDDYYAFGLAFNSYQRENSVKNNYKYNGIEGQDELDLGWDLAQFRAYEPTLGRFMQIDPVIKEHESPYAWNTNNPILYGDPTGADSLERAKALQELQRFIDANKTARKVDKDGNGVQHPLYSNTGTAGTPGEASDCSGTMSGCMTAAGVADPQSKGDVKTPEGGWSGVYTIEQHTDKIALSEVEPGSLISFKYYNSKGEAKYHIGMVTEVDVQDGQTSLTFGHNSFSYGPTTTTLTVGDGSYYDTKITGYYKWDSPDGAASNTSQSIENQSNGKKLEAMGLLFKMLLKNGSQ